MKIENIKVNSYGKLKNKEINLSNGINIIYGNNEAGKSTLLKFIENIFYGASKNKRGKIFSDYELYKPWDDEDFSGKINYKLDSGEKYEVYREFGKKNPKIYNEQLEDITKNYSIDKNTGSEFFYEQTNVDEFLFLSSVMSMQQDVKLNEQDRNIYIQKIANLASTGDDSVSYKKALDKLNKKQLDEIGTDRSQGKPINIVKKEISEYEMKLQNLEKYNSNKFEIEKQEEEIKKNIEKNKIVSSFIKELNLIKQDEKIELEKLNFKEQLRDKNNNQINELEKEQEEIKNKENYNLSDINYIKKPNFKIYIIICILLTILGIIAFFIFNNISLIVATFGINILTIAVYVFKNRSANKLIKNEEKNNQKAKGKLNEEINILKNKIEIIKKNNDEIEDEIKKLNNKLDMELDLKKENLKTKYASKLGLEKINSILDKENISEELGKIEEIIHKDELNLNMLKLEKRQTLEKLEEIVNIKEKLDLAKETYEELNLKNEKINKVKELMKIAYEKMKNNVTPKFTSNLSKIIENISDGKYNKVFINDTEGMIVGLKNGEYVSAEKLSTGTIEQLYLSLRLSMAKEISKENMPIILDEAFAYYDDERLKNTLEFLSDYFKDNQIIIVTCTNRERNILDSLNINYNLVNL